MKIAGSTPDFFELTALFFVDMTDSLNFATLLKKKQKNGKS
jgi:hypothetical protein